MKARVYYAPNFTTLSEWQAHLVTAGVPHGNALDEMYSDHKHGQYHWGVYEKDTRRVAIVEDYFDLADTFVKNHRSGRFTLVEEMELDAVSDRRLNHEMRQAIGAFVRGRVCEGTLISSTGDTLLYGRAAVARRASNGQVQINEYGVWPQVQQMKEAVVRAVNQPVGSFSEVVGV